MKTKFSVGDKVRVSIKTSVGGLGDYWDGDIGTVIQLCTVNKNSVRVCFDTNSKMFKSSPRSQHRVLISELVHVSKLEKVLA